ncbi:helix-turn-helix domain-containing protein [Streptomonospora wellingtoniae]|uniref:Helix-turn-helix transcriptional regulator n=1 Tax=Streptomonospora wellingtoniae TaxID=3075544 RepID=A0ABU2KW72_9ACTN|nr:helix-turn-helix transcriptional regulator [Streptomonospora sp. DSM 45055]MDT0303546.1 helix-turn-helix transcriptional regulator [Streptomonospora sp. DSM 45055]
MPTPHGITPTAGQGLLHGDREGRIAGYVLKVIRQVLGSTQEDLAERLRVDVTTVQGWESGRRPLTAVSAGTYLRIRHFLLRSGASPRLLPQLDTAMEADRFIGYVLSSEGPIELDGHPLASWVITRPFTDLLGWTFTGTAPAALAEAPVRRRGPAPPGPQLAADERRHVMDHLRDAAEQAAPDTAEGALLRRQAHYVAGYDQSSETVEWLAVMQRTEQRRLRSDEWTPSWAVVRSGAHTLARQGDADALPQFIGVHVETDECEIANLNYWAYWLGELTDPQLDDTFMIEVDLGAWHGDRLLEHLTAKLVAGNPYVDVVAHSLWSLVHRKPDAITPTRGTALSSAAKRILDEDGAMSPQSRRELNEVLYALRIIHRR